MIVQIVHDSADSADSACYDFWQYHWRHVCLKQVRSHDGALRHAITNLGTFWGLSHMVCVWSRQHDACQTSAALVSRQSRNMAWSTVSKAAGKSNNTPMPLYPAPWDFQQRRICWMHLRCLSSREIGNTRPSAPQLFATWFKRGQIWRWSVVREIFDIQTRFFFSSGRVTALLTSWSLGT